MPDAPAFTTAADNFNKTVQTIINKTLEEILRAPLPHLTPGNFITATHVVGSNATMRYLRYPDLTVDADELTSSLVQVEGLPNDLDKVSIGWEEFTTRQRMKGLSISDVALLESPQKLMAVNADKLARYVMELGDLIAATKIAAGTNLMVSGGGTGASDVTGGDVFTSGDIKKAVALLENGSVPRFPGDTYRGIMHPFVKFDVEMDDDAGGWLDANRYAGADALFTGELGKYAGVRFMSSSNSVVLHGAGSGSINVYSTTIFGPNFFAIGDFGTNETYVTVPGGHDDPAHQSAIIAWKGWVDAAVIGEMTTPDDASDPRYIRVLSAASLNPSVD